MICVGVKQFEVVQFLNDLKSILILSPFVAVKVSYGFVQVITSTLSPLLQLLNSVQLMRMCPSFRGNQRSENSYRPSSQVEI